MKVQMADEDVAAELRNWFTDIVRLWSSVCLDWSSSPEHRDAAILENLSRNAKLFLNDSLDRRGDLHRALTLSLVAHLSSAQYSSDPAALVSRPSNRGRDVSSDRFRRVREIGARDWNPCIDTQGDSFARH